MPPIGVSRMQVIEVPTQINFSPLLRRYTLEEFWALPEREDRVRYDLIGGYLFMVPPPNPPHGDIGARLNIALVKFLVSNYIDGEVHHPREAIWLRDEEGSTYLEPDMMYVSKALKKRLGQKRTTAEIVFEYLSERPMSTTAQRKPTHTWLSACANCGWSTLLPLRSKSATRIIRKMLQRGRLLFTAKDTRPSLASSTAGKSQLPNYLTD